MNRDTPRTRALLVLLLLTSVTLIAVDHRGGDDSPLRGLRSLAAAAFGPVEKAAAGVAGPVGDAVDRASNLGANASAADDSARLADENAELRRRVRALEQDGSRAAELEALMRTAGFGQYRVVPAQVIAIGAAQSFSWTVTIDAGRKDGIRPDMTVMNRDGLVGRVKTVGPVTATVLLVVDPESSVGVRLEGTDEIGITSGQGGEDDGLLSLQMLDAQSAVAEGDRLVSFGSRGAAPYVAGVPVGEVVRVRRSLGTLTRTATVRPFVDVTALDLLAVVVEPPARNPRDAVLPPRPAATPVPAVTVTVTARPKGGR